MRFLSLIAALVLGATLSAAHAATITDDAAAVTLWGGDIVAEAYAPLSDDPALPVGYVGLFGGLTGFDPAFALSLDYGAGETLFAETNAWAFDGDRVLSFVFDLAGEAAAQFGERLRISFTFDAALSDPFGAGADYDRTAQMVIAGENLPAVPLPGALPLLAGALALTAALRRRRAAA